MLHVLANANTLREFFGVTGGPEISADGMVRLRRQFAGDKYRGSERKRRQDWVEDEPQLGQQNPYAREFERLLHGPQVTRESIARREALRKIGPLVERYTQWLLGSKNIRIAIFPLGSSLKGYANVRSDVEFTVSILAGFHRSPNSEESKRILGKAVSLLCGKGYQADGMLTAITSVSNLSDITDGLIDNAFEAELKEIIDHPGYADDTFRLFLPAAFAAGSILEQARANFIEFAHERRLLKDVWPKIQHDYQDALRIEADLADSKPHLRRWLKNTLKALGTIPANSLPTATVFERIYLQGRRGHGGDLLMLLLAATIGAYLLWSPSDSLFVRLVPACTFRVAKDGANVLQYTNRLRQPERQVRCCA
jgi:hypothetical protein